MKLSETASTAHAVVYTTAALGRPRHGGGAIIGMPRDSGIISKKSEEAVNKVFLGVATLDAQLANARESKLSPMRIDAYRKEMSDYVYSAIGAGRKLIAQDRASTKASRDTLLRPPKVEPSDVTTTIREAEMRRTVAEMVPEVRARVRETLGQQPELVMALARDPLPSGTNTDVDLARSIYEQHAQQKHADTFALLDQQDEGSTVLEARLNALEALLKE
jgi:hypothetical protein